MAVMAPTLKDSYLVRGPAPVVPQAQHSLDWVRISHPRRDIAVAVEDAPDIDVVASLQVENEVRILFQRPEAQTMKTQLSAIA